VAVIRWSHRPTAPRWPAAALAAAALAAAGLAAGCSPQPGTAGQAAAICAAPAAGGAAGPPAAPAAQLRVDQAGYPTGAPAVAELMTASRDQAARRWLLVRRDGCTVTATGLASRYLGSWNSRYPAVWEISLPAGVPAGDYRIGLAGQPSAESPWFRIAPASSLYAQPLARALAFYAAQRDGPRFIRSPLRSAAGHLSDARAMTYRTPPMDSNAGFRGSLAPYATGTVIDASGGWFDAGDYLKFAETTSYTVAVMLQGAASFPRLLGPGGPAGFTGEARFGLDFLQRLWDERTRTLYYQVGIAEANSSYAGDHDLWRLPQADDRYHGTDPYYSYIRHRPVLRAGPPGAPLSPNLAGRLAASFALCYRVFRATDPAYAGRCLRSAETVYAQADTGWRGPLLTVAPFPFYPETSWRDDMMLGATELSLALHAAGGPGRLPAGLPVRSAAAYLSDAARWARSWVNGPQATADTLNLYDVSALADYELAGAIGAEHGTGLAVTPATLIAHLKAQLDRAAAVAAADPFGFGFAWNQEDTAAHGTGLSVMASEYDALTGGTGWAGQAQRWLDAILGANAWGASFIVGDGTTFPHCPSHQVANLAGSLTGQPPVLAGAVVEGPASAAATGAVAGMRACQASAAGGVPYPVFTGHGAVFADNQQSYATTEPAIDLTALSPLAFAWREAATAGTRALP
jgi:endoglucanase